MRKRGIIVLVILLLVISSIPTTVYAFDLIDLFPFLNPPDKGTQPSIDIKDPSFVAVNGFSVMQTYGDYVLKNGLWYDEYTRIYSVGGANRVAEVSNFPRVYEDKALHVYGVDTPFVVKEADLNYYDKDGNRFYKDRHEKLFREGETAVHFAMDSLPGSFPKWIEYKNLQPPKYYDVSYFKFNNVPAPINLKSMVRVVQNDAEPLLNNEVNQYRELVEKGKSVSFSKKLNNDNEIIYFHYKRIIEGEVYK